MKNERLKKDFGEMTSLQITKDFYAGGEEYTGLVEIRRNLIRFSKTGYAVSSVSLPLRPAVMYFIRTMVSCSLVPFFLVNTVACGIACLYYMGLENSATQGLGQS
jgi:hypothetical protein